LCSGTVVESAFDEHNTGAVPKEAEEGKPRRVTFVIEPLERIRSFVYRCDSEFLVGPLLEMASRDAAEYGFVIVDGSGGVLARVRGNKFTVVHRIADPVLPNKHRRGGQSAGRYFRNRLIARNLYVDKVTEVVTKVFIDEKTSMPNVHGLVLAGVADFKSQVAAKLDGRLRRLVRGVIDVSYGGAQGLTQAIAASAKTLEGISLHEQAAACGDFFDHVAKDDSKAVYGALQTLQALEDGAIDTLLLWEDAPLVRHEVKVTSGDSSNGKTEIEGDPAEEDGDGEDVVEVVVCRADADPLEKFLSGASEPSARARATVVSSQPLIEYLARASKDFGVDRVRLLSDCTPEGSQFCAGFGGVGGICRWPWTAVVEEDDAAQAFESDDDEFDALDDDAEIDFDISSFA
jgi:peptide chain release factor subunit 1